MKKFDKLVESVVKKLGSKIVCTFKFGSDIGLLNLKSSDIDILIVCKKKREIPKIISSVRKLEKNIFKIKHSATSDFIQRNFLGSFENKGMHLIVVSEDEFDKNFCPKNLRLKILTNLIVSRTLFLYNLKNNYILLYGKDLIKNIKLKKLTFKDRVLSLTLSYLILVILPIFCFNKKNFKIWCFKASTYYIKNIISCYRIALNNSKVSIKDIDYDLSMFNLAKKYRYQPDKYKKSLLKLYFNTWWYLIKNTSFIWKGTTKTL